ncbi:hypothetical protein [Agreia bicolorata]|uniref:hypothetical protein n=1 Tax=Agreia bicolorata TaxID=110935 RepID=UPI000695B4E7|nr:hypothetical protein [Agreia bicolorata]
MTDVTRFSPEYVAARRVLLDALILMREQLDALVLVGAQAVYHHAPLGDSRPTYTTDADLAIDPDLLASVPDLGRELSAAGFVLDAHGNPGHWISPDGIVIDLMVPAGSLPSSKRRTAPLDGQDRSTARSTRGLEAALHDNSPAEIVALDATDPRRVTIRVAGPAALVIAKSIKIRERLDAGNADRIVTKDAGDLLRLLRNVPPVDLGARLNGLVRHDGLREQIADVVTWLHTQFDGQQSTPLLRLVSQELDGIEPAAQSEQSLRLLGGQLLSAYSAMDA